jgi:hypothetical protein
MQGNGGVVESLGTNHADEVVSTAIPHNTVEPFTPDLLGEAVSSLGLNYMRDQDGDLCTFIPGEGTPCHAVCWFLIDDQYPQLFKLYCRVFPAIPKSKWQAAVFACNEYHTRYRFGRFYLSIKPEEDEATLCFAAQLDLSHGTTAAFLKTFIMFHLESVCDFLGDSQVHKRLFLAQRKRSGKATPTEVAHSN